MMRFRWSLSALFPMLRKSSRQPVHSQRRQLMRIEPETLPGEDTDSKGGGITIRHGESVVILPLGSSVEAAAMLVKALNNHA